VNPERWRIVTEIFHAALERPSVQRSRYLMEVCRQDPSLRADVDALLAGDDKADVFGDPLAAGRAALLPGTLLGPYRVNALLGAGGMGEVYEASDTRLNRQVAIKVLPTVFAQDIQLRQRFEREAHAAAALNHPNICALFDIGVHDGAPFIVSELLEGRTLRQVCANGPLTVRRALEYAAPIARGLAAAHLKGIVHRDIKPENLFITTEARVKILDFGLARLITGVAAEAHAGAVPTLTDAGIVMGTAGYMSPEQVRGLPADSRSDIFSFGTVLFEMLAGQRPFRGDTNADTASAILNAEPPSMTPESVPPALERIIRRCLEKDAPNRFQSADDLAFALEALTVTPGATATAAVDGPAAHARLLLPGLAIALAVAAVFLAAVWYANPPRVDSGAYRFTPFATGAGAAYDAVWSPDGRSIAYSKFVERRSQIFVRGLDGDSPEQITHQSLDDAGRPFWWPDGSRLGFMSGGSVWSVSRAGGAPELVQKIFVTAATLSPDGRTLAMWRTDFTTKPRGLSTVWLASPPNAVPREYTPAPFSVKSMYNPTYLQFSPDGKQLLLADWTDEGDTATWVLPFPESAQARRLVPKIRRVGPQLDPTRVAWMPDSQRAVMVFATGSTPKGGLWMVDVRTGAATPLAAGPTQQGSPSVSPDGTKIVFTSGGPGYDLVEVPLDGSPMRDFLATGSDEYSGAWVPGSSKYVYLTNKNGDEELRIHSQTENWDRLIVDRRLADRVFGGTTGLSAPVASPDGQHVAFDVSGAGGGASDSYSIWISHVGGGDPIRLTPPGASERAAAWSPDGQSIVCIHEDHGEMGLAVIRVGTRDPPHLLVPRTQGPPAWSPDGEWIAYQAGRNVRLVSPDGARQRILAPLTIFFDMNGEAAQNALVWSRDSKSLYSTRQTDDRVLQIVSIDAGSGAVRVVSTLGADVYFAAHDGLRFTLAPDGKSFLGTIVRTHTDLWILENFARRLGVLDWFRRRGSL
jgi:Tol biopolymer transport system component